MRIIKVEICFLFVAFVCFFGKAGAQEQIDYDAQVNGSWEFKDGLTVSGNSFISETDGLKSFLIRNSAINNFLEIGMAEGKGHYHGLTQKGDVVVRARTPNNFEGGKFIISNLYTHNHPDNISMVIGIAHQTSHGFWLHNNGNIRLGEYKLQMPTSKLEVEGNALVTGKIVAKSLDADVITANEVKVTAQPADFVFEEDYYLRPLEEVEIFISENKHLPEIPSGAQMMEEGVSVGEMKKLLLMKIEELTLYIINQEKRIKELENRN
jgi:hypothetical protein